MKKYIVIVGHSTQANNSLQKAIQEHVRSIDRLEVAQKDMPFFIKQFDKKVQELNTIASRCRPERVNWWGSNGTKATSDITNSTAGIYFNLYEVKEAFVPGK